MEPTSLDQLQQEEDVTLASNGLMVITRPAWVVEGEDRLSYTTLIRLIECCREHHWRKDVLSVSTDLIDSITKSITGEFRTAIPIGANISITYHITEIRRKGYSLKFEVRNSAEQTLYAECYLISVFYDAKRHQAVEPPSTVLSNLMAMCEPCSDG